MNDLQPHDINVYIEPTIHTKHGTIQRCNTYLKKNANTYNLSFSKFTIKSHLALFNKNLLLTLSPLLT